MPSFLNSRKSSIWSMNESEHISERAFSTGSLAGILMQYNVEKMRI
jgi:hypothetical protein